LARPNELLLVRNNDGKGHKRKRENFSPDSNKNLILAETNPRLHRHKLFQWHGNIFQRLGNIF
jgi:hypothetical protein